MTFPNRLANSVVRLVAFVVLDFGNTFLLSFNFFNAACHATDRARRRLQKKDFRVNLRGGVETVTIHESQPHVSLRRAVNFILITNWSARREGARRAEERHL